jgi:hypothetical protein
MIGAHAHGINMTVGNPRPGMRITSEMRLSIRSIGQDE